MVGLAGDRPNRVPKRTSMPASSPKRARIYEALGSGAAGDSSTRLYLLASLAWLDAGKTAEATAAYNRAGKTAGGPTTATLGVLAAAGLKVATGDADGGMNLLDTLAGDKLTLTERLRFQGTRGKALFALGKPGEATSMLVRREFWLESEHGVAANHQMIWDGLRAENTESLQSALDQTDDQTVAGWLALVLATNPARNNKNALRMAVNDWQRRFPGHAANNTFIPVLIDEDTGQISGSPQRIALLLPLNGRGRGAATAIRDGFVAAYVNSGPAMNGRRIQIYDTSAMGAIGTYNNAIAEGADLIVGPLTKTAVREIATAESLPIPVLALNHLPAADIGPANLFQFALAPEDEASEVARRAIASGEHRAVALVPIGDWGDRVLNSFANSLSANGGVVLDYETYDPNETDFSNPIKRVLQIGASVARRNRMRNLVDQPLQFEPRRRQDIDFIFLAATTSNARALKPSLRFHYAASLPVYATSTVYTEDGRNNKDLRGIMFPEIPWIIAPETAPRPSISDFSQYWRSQPQVARLHAMGIDAYGLIDAIFVNRMDEPVNGATGILTMSGDGRISRELGWATYDGEKAVRLPDLEMPETGGEPPLINTHERPWPEASGSN